MNLRLERFQGCMLGLAVGDALGTTLEFQQPGTFTPLTDIVGGGPFALRPGQWTDDTSMALCLAESLISKHGFDSYDQLTRYLAWYQEGHLSSTGTCFDIGSTVLSALEKFEKTKAENCGSTDPKTAGNGSLMRLAPVPLFYANEPALAVEMAGASSLTTHAAPTAVDACRFFASLIVGAVRGFSKVELLADTFEPVPGLWEQKPLVEQIAEIAAGSYKRKKPPEIKGTGFVVQSLEAALWAFSQSSTYADGALLAVNLGDDADTTGAVYGQLAGAYYGLQDIPAHWQEQIQDRDLILQMAEQIFQLGK